MRRTARPSGWSSTSASNARNAARSYQEPEPRLFSFNNPYGACPRCQGFRQHHRFRYRSRDSGQKQIAGRRRDRAVDQAALPPAGHGNAPIRAHQRHSRRRSVPRSDRRAARRHSRRRQEGRLSRRERFLRLARAQEIQAARARFSQPLSRLRHLPGLQRHAAARRGARRENRRDARSPKSAR